MIDRLRMAWQRPLSARAGRRLFAVAVLLIVTAGVALAAIDKPDQARSPRPPATTAATPAGEAPAAASGEREPVAPSEEGQPEGIASPREIAAARRAARRFLTGYLPYSYGRRSARWIEAATSELRELLAEQRPHVPPAERRRVARILLIEGQGVGVVRARMVAVVADGARRYQVPLQLVRARGGWLVNAVGG